VVYSKNKVFDPQQLRQQGKAILLINNGIHPGEPDGIDASMMLLRNITRDRKLQALLDNIVIAVIPVYNVDGHMNRGSYSRANQNGPEAYGFRGNYRNLDLNRDFIKTDSRNSRAFQEIFQAWNPDVLVDTHVSNGADYQYVMTYIATQHNKLGGELGQYIENRMSPQLETEMKKRRFEMTPYVNHWEPGAVTSIVQFLETPRYSSGYAALFGTLGFITETHMLKPYKARVESTYAFLQSMLQVLNQDRVQILQMRENFRRQSQTQQVFPLAWQNDRSRHKPITFKGYEHRMLKSEISGLDRLYYDRTKPVTTTIPFYNQFVASAEATRPQAFVIPQAWHEVISLLELNGLTLNRITRDTTIQVQAYYIENFQTSPRPYEGHYIHSNTQVRKEVQQVPFYAGDYILRMNQAHNRYAMETLEPQATDSFFNWGFFDSILQQKEGFSDYVFEEIAAELMRKDPALAQALAEQKQADATFAASHRAQLEFIYKRSPYYERTHNRYPVFRIE
jgi:hypothetical protein